MVKRRGIIAQVDSAGHTALMRLTTMSVKELFIGSDTTDTSAAISSDDFERGGWKDTNTGCAVVTDRFLNGKSSCCFLRFNDMGVRRRLRFFLDDPHSLKSCPGGGWLIAPERKGSFKYWIPLAPLARRLDKQGHILSEAPTILRALDFSDGRFALEVESLPNHCTDCVIWGISPDDETIITTLNNPSILETQSYFLWGSHTQYRKPADVYLHLVHGHAYENRVQWPKNWRIYSENDAHALYGVLTGLWSATGAKLYDLLRKQITYSVISRQCDDGGWRHGEWSDNMESHYRLHCSAMHMLMDALAERHDDVILQSLHKAAAFLSRQTDNIRGGIWFLHDELEKSDQQMNEGPFRWVSSRVLGKSSSNMLVLNTHLDALVAMARYQEVTGTKHFQDHIVKGNEAARIVVGLRTADWLYRPLFWALALTMLPTHMAEKLPLPIRAIKRLSWKYLAKWLPYFKTVFPRLVMPSGYIDRALSVGALSDAYHSVNLMDLVRYKRQFATADFDDVIERGFTFVENSAIRNYWSEKDNKKYALGFLAEAYYHLCTLDPSVEHRIRLAQTIMELEQLKLGLPPSLLGANAEAVKIGEQRPCPIPSSPHLRVANLCRGEAIEILVVNPTNELIDLTWQEFGLPKLAWISSKELSMESTEAYTVPTRGWLLGKA